MKICFVGLGSIGLRHLKNLTDILRTRGISFTIDALRSGSAALPEAAKGLIRQQYTSTKALPNGYDIAFITNPTRLHYETIQSLCGKTRHMFIEKPVFDCTNVDLSALPFCTDSVYYVACPMRYTAVLTRMKLLLSEQRVFAVRAICSSYLPDWRPGSDYRTCYSAQKALGGGVAIDLIHEWDYLCDLFGVPEQVQALAGTCSNLEITSDDVAVYIARYPDMLLSLHLDYFGRYTTRELEIYTADDVIVGDLTNSRIYYKKQGTLLDLKEDRDAYQRRELEAFLDMIDGKAPNTNPIEVALGTLKIAIGEG